MAYKQIKASKWCLSYTYHLTCSCTDRSSFRFSDFVGLCLALLLFFVFVVFLLVGFAFLLFLLVLRLLEEKRRKKTGLI